MSGFADRLSSVGGTTGNANSLQDREVDKLDPSWGVLGFQGEISREPASPQRPLQFLPYFLSALTIVADTEDQYSSTPQPAAELHGQSLLASCRRSVLAAAKRPAPGWARRLSASQLCGTDRGTRARAPLTLGSSPACGQQQRGQQRQRWRARPAVARPVHSSSRGGGGGSLAARRTSTGSPWAPDHLVTPAGTRRIPGGTFPKLFVPLTCSLCVRLAASDPGMRFLGVLRSSPASASRSVPGGLGRSSAPCVPGSDSRRPCPVPGAVDSGLARRRLLQLSAIALLAKLVTFHQLYNPDPQLGPMAEAGPGRGPSALCCRLLDPHPPVPPRKPLLHLPQAQHPSPPPLAWDQSLMLTGPLRPFKKEGLWEASIPMCDWMT